MQENSIDLQLVFDKQTIFPSKTLNLILQTETVLNFTLGFNCIKIIQPCKQATLKKTSISNQQVVSLPPQH